MDKKFFSSHLLHSECEGEGSYGEGETFRNGDDNQSNRDDQGICEGNTLLDSSPTRRNMVVGTPEAVKEGTLTMQDPQFPIVRKSESLERRTTSNSRPHRSWQ